MDDINTAFRSTDASLRNFFANSYVSTALIVFALVYAAMAATNLPPFIASLFESTFFKFLMILLILVLLKYNIPLALLLALGFVLSLQSLNRYHSYSMVQDGMNSRAAYAPTAAGISQGGIPGTYMPTSTLVGQESIQQMQEQSGGNFLGDLGQRIGAIPSEVAGSLRNLPSSFSTVKPIMPSGPSMLNVNTGCPAPTSCQNFCGGQPMPPTALPPYEHNQVVGICSCDTLSAQGFQFPPGYEYLSAGADIDH